jgi:DNA-binding transcriptional ArsR family regulator
LLIVSRSTSRCSTTTTGCLGGNQDHQVTVSNFRRSQCIGKFIFAADVSWVCAASRLGVTALLLGMLLWHLRGLRRSDSFLVSNLMASEWGIEPDAKARALRKLERAGLVAIERRGKRSPQVTLLVSKTLDGTQ